MDLVLIGAPGSGKGTQALILEKNFSYTHVASGELLRREIALKTTLSEEIAQILARGELVSDGIVFKLIENKLADNARGRFVFDGFPRTLEQARFFVSKLMKDRKFRVVFLKINQDSLVMRLSNRRVTPDGKYTYNLLTSPPKKAGFCDITGLELVQRIDDTEDVVRRRLDLFNKQTTPIESFFLESGLLQYIDANAAVSDITAAIVKNIDG